MQKNNLVKKISTMVVLLLSLNPITLLAGDFHSLSPQSEQTRNSHPFADNLAVNESRTKTIYANREHNWTGVRLIDGQTYKFTVGSPAWSNGGIVTDAEGYSDSGLLPLPNPYVRRFPDYNWMALVGSLYTYQDKYSYTGRSIVIGLGRTWKANKTGYVSAFANDCEDCYGDNSRVVTLTIKRIE